MWLSSWPMLDSCSRVLYSLPSPLVNKLQRLQYTAVRLTKKCDHITPVLCKLHWLPRPAKGDV